MIQKAEQIFIPIKNVETNTLKLKNFISDNFQIPNVNLDIICEFINKDIELKKIIFQLPDIIKQAVSYDNLSIKFFDEFQDEFTQLEIEIYVKLDPISSLDIEQQLEHKLYQLFQWDSVDKILLIMD